MSARQTRGAAQAASRSGDWLKQPSETNSVQDLFAIHAAMRARISLETSLGSDASAEAQAMQDAAHHKIIATRARDLVDLHLKADLLRYLLSAGQWVDNRDRALLDSIIRDLEQGFPGGAK
jgi:hypothetical protein